MTSIKERCSSNQVILVFVAGIITHALVLFIILPIVDSAFGSFYGLGFADDYDKLALNISNGNGYKFSPETAETLMREPGYPYLLAAIFSISGYSLLSARVLNLLLAAGTVWLIVKMVQRVSDNRMIVSVAIALFFLHPGILVAEARGSFETLYMFCLVLLAWFVSRAISTHRKDDYFYAGIVLGATVLIRSSLIAFPVVVLVWLLFRRKILAWKEVFPRIAVFILGMCLVVSPWILRNFIVVQKVVPTATISGIAIHVGKYVCQHRASDKKLQDLDKGARDERAEIAYNAGYKFNDEFFPHFYSAKDELEYSNSLRKISINYYKDNPAEFLGCAVRNLGNFWFAGKSPSASILNAVVQVPYILLAIVGGLWLKNKVNGNSQVTSIALLILYSMVAHAVTFAQARYSIPFIPLLAILGAHPIVKLYTRVVDKK